MQGWAASAAGARRADTGVTWPPLQVGELKQPLQDQRRAGVLFWWYVFLSLILSKRKAGRVEVQLGQNIPTACLWHQLLCSMVTRVNPRLKSTRAKLPPPGLATSTSPRPSAAPGSLGVCQEVPLVWLHALDPSQAAWVWVWAVCAYWPMPGTEVTSSFASTRPSSWPHPATHALFWIQSIQGLLAHSRHVLLVS